MDRQGLASELMRMARSLEGSSKRTARLNITGFISPVELKNILLELQKEVDKMEEYATEQSGGMPSPYSYQWREYKRIIDKTVDAFKRVKVD